MQPAGRYVATLAENVLSVSNPRRGSMRLGYSCLTCASRRLINVCGKCNDQFDARTYAGEEYDGYVPEGIGLDNCGDYIELTYCLNCGQIQANFPISEEQITKAFEEEEE
jgi:hypothetical protein